MQLAASYNHHTPYSSHPPAPPTDSAPSSAVALRVPWGPLRSGYEIQPDLQEIKELHGRMVSDLKIRKDEEGEIAWLDRVDARADFSNVTISSANGIEVNDKYLCGKRVRVTLVKKGKRQEKLEAHCEKNGLTFIGYDDVSGKWTFETKLPPADDVLDGPTQ